MVGLFLVLTLTAGLSQAQNNKILWSDKVFAYTPDGVGIGEDEFETPVMIVLSDSVTILTQNKQVYTLIGENKEGGTFLVSNQKGERAILEFVRNGNGFFLVLQFDDIVVGYRIAVPAADTNQTPPPIQRRRNHDTRRDGEANACRLGLDLRV
jgi:hypothetical protein